MATDERLDGLIGDQLKIKASGAVIGREVIVLEQTSSTNDAISRIASTDDLASISEGLVVFAEHQTAGRGQHGKHWESTAAKGLWFSILLRPGIQLSDSGRLTIWAIEAISHVIRTEIGLEPAIKLPNDVQLNGQKVAGVLVEMRAQDNAPHLAVVGIGVNVNQCRHDFPVELQDRATSLAMASGHEIDRQNFALTLLQNLDVKYRETFLARDVVAKGDDLGSQFAQARQRRSTPAAKTAPLTRRDKRAAKSRTA